MFGGVGDFAPSLSKDGVQGEEDARYGRSASPVGIKGDDVITTKYDVSY